MKEQIRLVKGRPPYKWRAEFQNGHKVNFGRVGYSDYTIHKDKERMGRYLTRHRRRENWGSSGRYTAGFWSRWLLWSKPSLKAAIRETERALGQKYKIRI
jgi:hypothetical protein